MFTHFYFISTFDIFSLDGIEASLIHKFEHHEDEEEEDEDDEDDPNKANEINLNIPALAKYQRMKKMGMPMHAIVNKMKLSFIYR